VIIVAKTATVYQICVMVELTLRNVTRKTMMTSVVAVEEEEEEEEERGDRDDGDDDV